MSHISYTDEVAKGRLLEARQAGQAFVTHLRGVKEEKGTAAAARAGAERLFGTSGVHDYATTTGNAVRRQMTMSREAEGYRRNSRAYKDAMSSADSAGARAKQMPERAVGEARKIRRNTAIAAGTGGVMVGGALVAARPKHQQAVPVMSVSAAKAYTLSKAARKLPRDLAGLEAELARQAKDTQAAIDTRDRVVAEHKPVVDAYARQNPASKPVRRKAPVKPVAAPAPKPRARKKAAVPESLHLNPNPPKAKAKPRPKAKPAPGWHEQPAGYGPRGVPGTAQFSGDAQTALHRSSRASAGQIRRGALIGAGVGAAAAGAGALYALHRAKKRRQGSLQPVGKGLPAALRKIPAGPLDEYSYGGLKQMKRLAGKRAARTAAIYGEKERAGVKAMSDAQARRLNNQFQAERQVGRDVQRVFREDYPSVVGKARVPKPKVGSLVKAPVPGGRARNATVAIASNGKRKLVYQNPKTVSRDPSAPKPSYALHNFTTGPMWQAGGYAAAHPVRTAAAATGLSGLAAGSFMTGRKSNEPRYF